MWRSYLKNLSARNKLSLLFALILVQVSLAAGFWNSFSEKPVYGILVKVPGEYLVAWRNSGAMLEFRTISELSAALEFAKTKLQLERSAYAAPARLERLWMEERAGKFVLLWKVVQSPYLHQITFDRKADADYFADSFRRGGYAASTFGHSILLMPSSSHL